MYAHILPITTSQQATSTYNAVAELMSQSKRPKPPSIPAADAPEKVSKPKKGWDPRDGLGIYIESPETNPEGRVLDYDDDFVVITDKYPKARYVLHHSLPKHQQTKAKAILTSTPQRPPPPYPPKTSLLHPTPAPRPLHRSRLPHHSPSTHNLPERPCRLRAAPPIRRPQRLRQTPHHRPGSPHVQHLGPTIPLATRRSPAHRPRLDQRHCRRRAYASVDEPFAHSRLQPRHVFAVDEA